MSTNKMFFNIPDVLETPCYLFDIDRLHEEVLSLQKYIPKEKLIYSIKANPFLIEYISNEVRRFEVCSLGELNICISKNIPPHKISVAGINKSPSYLKRAVQYGVTRYIIESSQQWNQLQEQLDIINHPSNIQVLLRVSIGNQFGMELEEIQELLHSSDCIKFVKGFHIYMGTQNQDFEKIRTIIKQFKSTINSVASGDLNEITVGIGYPVLYYNDHRDINKELLPSIINELESIFSDYSIEYEFGRKIAASCGKYFTKVIEIRTRNSKQYVIVDGGTHQINYYGQLYGRRLPFITQYPKHNGTNRYTVCGSLCSASDILVHNHEMNLIELGDILCFENAGAYSITEGCYLFLSHPLPIIYTFKQTEGIRILRNKIDTDFINGGAL